MTHDTAPISRLPPEILESIFILQAHDYHSMDGVRDTGVPEWVNVSYVCRRWRDVALSCPTLWSYLFVQSERWTGELLARSKPVPLKFRAQLDCRYALFLKVDSVAKQVMNHMPRIQQLDLYIPFACGQHQILSWLSSPAPCLENLTIWMGKCTFLDYSSTLFDGHTPALRTLALSRCPVPWYSFKLDELTTLSLEDVPMQQRQDMKEFLTTLGRMQGLEHLHLDNATASTFSFLSGTASHNLPKVDLPHLSRLSIVAPVSTVVILLAYINIPPKTKLRLGCLYGSGPTPFDDHARLCSFLTQRFSTSDDQAHSSPTIRSLVVKSTHEDVTLTFSASERDYDSSDFKSYREWRWDSTIPLEINVNLPLPTTSNKDRIINDIYCSVPLTNVQSVHTICPPLSLVFWRHVLGNIQDLRFLKLSKGGMPNLASILSLDSCYTDTENQDGQAARRPDRVPAPALEELMMHRIAFSAPWNSDMSPSAYMQSLYDALSSRTGSRGQLTMVRCAMVDYDYHRELDVVGRWEDGRFYVVEER